MKNKKIEENYNSLPNKITLDNFYGIKLDEEQLIFANHILDKNKDIIFVNSKAGCGKSLVAVGVANILVACGQFDNIVYIMSPYGERKQGFLAGSITEKSSVYFEPLYQALITCNVNPNTAINDDTLTNQKNGTGYVTCITDTFLRGSSLSNAVVIIDEAQNYTTSQLKKVLTRIKDDSKVIVIGHNLQCDLDSPKESGFTQYIEHFKECDRTAICKLTTNHRGWVSQWADELV